MEDISTYTRKPTILQARTLQIMVANGGKMPLSKAMREAGYSESMARNSHKLSKTKAFKDFLEEVGLTDDRIAKKYAELFDASKIITLDIGWSTIIRNKYVCPSQKVLRKAFNIKGYKILYIVEDKFKKKSTIYFKHSVYKIQYKVLESVCKIKGYYNQGQAHNVLKHELTAEEKKTLINIFK